MESPSQPPIDKEEFYAPPVDPFLVEALQNPRHRLTILRMELDIQKFLRNSAQQQYEFQHLPSSYLRLAAHRVAQHYGLQTVVHDNPPDCPGNRITAMKTAGFKYPAICLSEIPAKQPETDKPELIKIAIRRRPDNGSPNEMRELGCKRSHVKTVEERKEEYDRARARIFSNPSSPVSDDSLQETMAGDEGKSWCLGGDENEVCRNSERSPCIRDGFMPSRVAILRDREKDRTDPDYDRNYVRYVRNDVPANQSFGPAPFNQFPYVQYDTGFSHMGQMPQNQAYGPSSSQLGSPFGAAKDPVYVQWPSPAVMYAQTCEQYRHAFFQAPFCQQPLSFGFKQNN